METDLGNSDYSDKWDFNHSDEFYALKGVEILDMFDRKIILSHTGVWCVIANKKLFSAHQNTNVIPFFPFLELGCENFISIVKKKLESKNMSAEIAYSFPLKYIISAALGMQSDYWVKLSISWLNCFTFDSEISDLLSYVMSSKWLSQSTRHLAKKMFFRFNKHS
ncbi:hypothetical protein IC235_17030 [Hymenobacter sp. BT664]|uniref:Uncharacterized protein n=1 Tax=Hymenobacter montanus TaxID=2771359 RepID=A0A927BEW6_9BACT|nr:hypothetical protein [Hymenobacter montanus]MBD2769595.1 hypothetical protein [Hymenobacter montanus]